VHLYQVLGRSKIESRLMPGIRLVAHHCSGERRSLISSLRRCEQAKCGEGRVVVLIGEPGIGKSSSPERAEPGASLRSVFTVLADSAAFKD
jgi:hypothetical protein